MNLRNPFGMAQNAQLTDVGLLILRVGVGFFMLYGHGWSKLLKLFGAEPIEFMEFLGLSPTISFSLVVFAEFLCSLLLIFGLFTRWVVIPLIIAMSVAAFYRHLDDPFGRKEKALLYIVSYISLLLAGAGRYSLDAFFGKK